MNTDELKRLRETHEGAMAAIAALVAPLLDGETSPADWDSALEAIHQDPLSIRTRSGWTNPGEIMRPEEFEIVLTTGGPAVRIVGDLDEHGDAASARLEVQDWFLPWTSFPLSKGEQTALDSYVSQFCFLV